MFNKNKDTHNELLNVQRDRQQAIEAIKNSKKEYDEIELQLIKKFKDVRIREKGMTKQQKKNQLAKAAGQNMIKKGYQGQYV